MVNLIIIAKVKMSNYNMDFQKIFYMVLGGGAIKDEAMAADKLSAVICQYTARRKL